MKLAAAAYPIDWQNRWNDYVGKLRVWVRAAVDGGAEMLVFPEYAALELASLAGKANATDPAHATLALSARIKDVDDLHASLASEFNAHLCAASGPLRTHDGSVVNRARLFAPDGARGAQDKMIPEAWESDAWAVAPGSVARVFETALGRIGVLIGRDVEAPEIAAAMAGAGAAVLLAPGFATTPEAADRRREAALERARETGCILVQAVALGAADWAAPLGRATGAAAIFGRPGEGAPPDGVVATGKADAPGWVQAEVASASPPAARVATVEGRETAVEIATLEAP